MKRLLSAVAAVVLGAAAVAVPTAAHAATSPTCTWTVPLPVNYRISSTIPKITLTTWDLQHQTTCASNINFNGGPQNWKLLAALTRTGATTPSTTLHFQGCNHTAAINTTTCGDISNASVTYTYMPALSLKLTTPGTYTTSQDGDSYADTCSGFCDTPTDYSITFTVSHTTAKYSTTTGLSITQSGAKRTFTITPRHYSPSAKAYVRSVNVPVYLQRYVSSKWTTYKTLKSASNPIKYSANFTKAYKWRAYSPTITSSWSSASSAITR